MNEEISKHIVKTGTLTIGIVCKEGLVLAADRRQSYGGGGGVQYIARTAKKIQEVNQRILATTAGNASDSRKELDILRAELRLKELKTKNEVSVDEAANLLANMVFRSIRTPSTIPSIAHFLVAGYDESGIHLFDISPDGYIDKIADYAATGSGIMQAHPILDSEFKKNMSLDDGIKLAVKCIKASTGRDPSVGEGIDVYTIKKGELKHTLDQEFSRELKNTQ